jgi:hypothetical protein
MWGMWGRRRTFHVFVRASASPRFEKAMKDLLPWKGCGIKGRRGSKSSMSLGGAKEEERKSGKKTHFELEV